MAGSREVASERGMVHGRTLLGAIDSHLGDLAHTRPWVLSERSEALEEMAGAWLEDGGENWLPSLRPAWLSEHVEALPPEERASRSQTLAEFVGWAAERGLVSPPVRPNRVSRPEAPP